MLRRISLINVSEQNDLSNIVYLRSIRGNTYVDYIVDTGSPLTIMPYQKVIELNLPIKDLHGEEDIRLLGTKHKIYIFPKPIQFSFLCEDGTILSLNYSPLIAKPISESNENWILTELILGLNFLRDNCLKLFCDMKNNVAYLEKSDYDEKNKIKSLLEDLKDVTNAKEIKEGGFGVGFENL